MALVMVQAHLERVVVVARVAVQQVIIQHRLVVLEIPLQLAHLKVIMGVVQAL